MNNLYKHPMAKFGSKENIMKIKTGKKPNWKYMYRLMNCPKGKTIYTKGSTAESRKRKNRKRI